MTGPAWFKDQCQPPQRDRSAWLVADLRRLQSDIVNWISLAGASRRCGEMAAAFEQLLAEKDRRIEELLEAKARFEHNVYRPFVAGAEERAQLDEDAMHVDRAELTPGMLAQEQYGPADE